MPRLGSLGRGTDRLVRHCFSSHWIFGVLAACVLAFATATASAQFLFDATKAEMAGNADWVIDADAHNLYVSSASDGSGKTGGSESNPQRIPTPAASGITSTTAETYWTGALSAWGVALVQHGQSVETLPYNGQITYGNASNAQDLSHYKVFVLAEPNILFTATEKTAIVNFVKNGGGLYFISDHTGSDRNNDGSDAISVWADLETNNSVASDPFGVTINLDKLTTSSPSVAASTADPIIHGSLGAVTSYMFDQGATMTIDPTQNASVKGAVFKTSAQNPGDVMAAYGTYGAGRFVVTGDTSPYDDGTGDPGDTLYDGWHDGGGNVGGLYNDGRLALNASLWLAVPEPSPAGLLAVAALGGLMLRRRR